MAAIELCPFTESFWEGLRSPSRGAWRGVARSGRALRARLDHIALVIETDVDGLAVLCRAAAPHTVVVLLQVADVGEAHLFDAGLGFAFRKAVATSNRSGDLSI